MNPEKRHFENAVHFKEPYVNIVKMILGKIGAGLLYGVGFGIVMALITWGSAVYFESKSKDRVAVDYETGGCSRYKRCEDSAGLVVTITKERIDDKDFILLGNVKNNGKIKWTSVKLKAELFDKNNNFIDECSEYIDQNVFPNTTVNFKLSCTKCSKIDLQDYNSYKVLIIDGSTY
jgi:hypothetical protein